LPKFVILPEAEHFLKNTFNGDVMVFVQKSMSVTEGLNHFNDNPDHLNDIKEYAALEFGGITPDTVAKAIDSFFGTLTCFQDANVRKAVAISLLLTV